MGVATAYVTKVIKESFSWLIVVWLLATALVCGCWAQPAQSSPQSNRGAETVYLQWRSVGLRKCRVYKAPDISFDRGAFHITLDDGTIAFTEDVMGRVTGAFFEGDGEVLLVPPDQVERASMALFTGAAILEERFVTAYFRFNDRSEEHTSELQSPYDLVCRLLLEKKKKQNSKTSSIARLLIGSVDRTKRHRSPPRKELSQQ